MSNIAHFTPSKLSGVQFPAVLQFPFAPVYATTIAFAELASMTHAQETRIFFIADLQLSPHQTSASAPFR